MRTSNGTLFNNADMSTTHTSAFIPLNAIFGYSIQLEFTGAPVGTTQVFVSCDPNQFQTAPEQLPTNWTLLADSTLTVNAAGNIMYNVSDVQYNWFYVVYNATSGTGSLTGRFNLKGF